MKSLVMALATAFVAPAWADCTPSGQGAQQDTVHAGGTALPVASALRADGTATFTLFGPACRVVATYDMPGRFIVTPGAASSDKLAFHVIDGLPGDPLVLLTAASPGASDTAFFSVLLRVGPGRVAPLLTPDGRPMTSVNTDADGGAYVGDLGGGLGPGLAAWSRLPNNAAAAAPHQFRLDRWRIAGDTLRPVPSIETPRAISFAKKFDSNGLDYPNLIDVPAVTPRTPPPPPARSAPPTPEQNGRHRERPSGPGTPG